MCEVEKQKFYNTVTECDDTEDIGGSDRNNRRKKTSGAPRTPVRVWHGRIGEAYQNGYNTGYLHGRLAQQRSVLREKKRINKQFLGTSSEVQRGL